MLLAAILGSLATVVTAPPAGAVPVDGLYTGTLSTSRRFDRLDQCADHGAAEHHRPRSRSAVTANVTIARRGRQRLG